jgi:hypothetical protein
LDRPRADRERPACVFPVTQELVQQTGVGYAGELVKLGSRGTLSTNVNWKGDPKNANFLIDGVNIPMRVKSFDRRNCGYQAEGKGVRLPGEEIANIGMIVNTIPSYRVHLEATKVRVGGVLQRGTQRFFFLPFDGPVAEQPPPGDIPVVPPTPGAPDERVSPTGFPIYPGGPLLLNGARGNGKVWALPHADCDGHTVTKDGMTYRVCTAGEGETSLTTFNVTPEKFDMRKTSPARMGWEWSPFSCERAPDGTVGCSAKGKYLGYDILGTISNLQVTPGTLNFGANLNVRLLSTQGDVGFRAAGQIESLGF